MKVNFDKLATDLRANAFHILGGLALLAAFIGMFFYATSKEVWYAGMHDSQHEGENCHCYERFMADPNN